MFLHSAVDNLKGTVVVEGDWGITERQPVTLVAGENKVNVTLTHNTPDLWWANGMGAQPMYNVSVWFEPAAAVGATESAGARAKAAQPLTVVRRIGFRHVVLVTSNGPCLSLFGCS